MRGIVPIKFVNASFFHDGWDAVLPGQEDERRGGLMATPAQRIQPGRVAVIPVRPHRFHVAVGKPNVAPPTVPQMRTSPVWVVARDAARAVAGEGIAQLIFLAADGLCRVSYRDRKGKYQAQKGIVLSRVESEGEAT